MTPRKALILFWSLCVVPLGAEPAKPAVDPELTRTIAALDAALFDAFNRCDLQKLGTFFVDDLEFYHDKGGLSRSRKSFLEAVERNVCGKMSRELVPETLEVFPLPGFGALEMGTHRFHHPGHDATEPVGEGRFVHIWQNTNGSWQITRVMSYDHHALAK